MLFTDSIAIICVLFVSFFVRLGYFFWPHENLLLLILVSPVIAIPIFFRFDLYQSIVRYIGFAALWDIVKAVSLYALVWGLLVFMTASFIIGPPSTFEGVPRSVILINWFLAVLVLVGWRMIARWLLTNNKSVDATNVLIYGAGSAGIQLSIALMQSREYNPIAFIDDNAALHGRSIHGINVISLDEFKDFYNKKNVKEVLLALPSISRLRRNEIIDYLEPFPVLVRSLPGVTELAQGKVKIEDLREISIKDLLGRDSVVADQTLLKMNVSDKVVMVTGAGGSIGSELCRQIILLKPKMLIMFDHSEFFLYSIDKELSNKSMSNVKLLPILGSVNNSNRLRNILNRFHVDTIYHAAAYKHVPMVEFNNAEGIINNIFGTLSCAQAAIDGGVKTFVLISTDKAVRPTNIMGASKRLAEMVLQAFSNKQSITKFSMVRFGNVLGSSGSVIPLFSKQIQEGGPITVTDSKMVRYFMTIPEAVELVIQSGAMGEGGDVFVLNMGDPVSIDSLAKKMIHLSGLQVKDKSNPSGDIEIKYTGLRPGEKLFEELLIGGNVLKTNHPMIMCAQEDMIVWDELKPILDDLMTSVETSEYQKLRDILMKTVPGFQPQNEITDFLYSEKSEK